MEDKQLLEQYRYFLKDHTRLAIDFSQTDQSLKVPPPPLQKPADPDLKRIDLVAPGDWKEIGKTDLFTAIDNRRSRRRYLATPLTLEELSFLLYSTQGIQKKIGVGSALRTVPSAGARHAFETYLAVLNVEGLETGLYRYLPLEHQLLFERKEEELAAPLVAAALGQRFTGRSAVTFIWTVIPYRMEWRYSLAAHRVILMDVGHVCQNLYLACEAIGAGTCAIAAFHQTMMDRLLRLDGEEEFTIYMAPVGKI